ncbi:DnaD domain protein [Candidatus Mycoplasma pogonae]
MKYTTFFIETKQKIDCKDTKNLRTFYLPFLGTKAITLYQYLVDLTQSQKAYNDFYEFESMILETGLAKKQILEAKDKLEAVGLIRYYESDSYNNALFELNKPLDAKAINENKIISNQIAKKIGMQHLEKLLIANLNYYFDKSKYSDKTKRFYDIFKMDLDELRKMTKPAIISQSATIINNESNLLEKKQEQDTEIGAQVYNHYFKVVNRPIAPSSKQIIKQLLEKGFSETAICYFIDFSNAVNQGKINFNYINKIALSYLDKGITSAADVYNELQETFFQKNNKFVNNNKPKYQFSYETNDLFSSSFNQSQQEDKNISLDIFATNDSVSNQNNDIINTDFTNIDELLEQLKVDK